MSAAQARIVSLTSAAALAAVLVAPVAYAERAPVPDGYQAPLSTAKVSTVWTTPLSSVSRVYVNPAEIPKEQLTESLGAKEKSAGTLVTLSDRFLFEFGSADLASTAAASLDSVVALMAGTAGTVTVTGHTDSIGGDAVNQPLSVKRAESLKPPHG